MPREIDGNELDRWITGNYGEDRFKDGILNDGSELQDGPPCEKKKKTLDLLERLHKILPDVIYRFDNGEQWDDQYDKVISVLEPAIEELEGWI